VTGWQKPLRAPFLARPLAEFVLVVGRFRASVFAWPLAGHVLVVER